MSTASYVGRVGGLAVALGIGTAVLTGYGVAFAETSSGGAESTSSSSNGAADSSSTAGSSTTDGVASSDSGARSDAASDVDVDAGAEVDAGDDDASDELSVELADDLVDGTDDPVDGFAEDTHQAVVEEVAESSGSGGTGHSSSGDDAPAGFDDGVDGGDDTDNVVAPEEASVEVMAAALEGLSDVEGSADPVPMTPTAVASVLVEPEVEPVAAEAELVSTPIVSRVEGVDDSSAVDGPAVPVSTPLGWTMAAAARRDSLGGILGEPITVDPATVFTDGVIYGNVNAGPDPGSLIYTVADEPAQGGKVTLIEGGAFSFLPDLSVVGSGGADQFGVMVSELSDLMNLLAQIPLLGALVEPIVVELQQVPLVGGLLQPIIGYRTFAKVDVDVGELVPEGAPVAFTTKITSFDGVQISANWFPALGLEGGGTAPSVLNGPGLSAAGDTDPTSVLTTGDASVGIAPLREAGYNYVSWDPRGEHASGGFLQLDNPFFEGRDTQRIIDWLATLPETRLDAPGDPTMGMVGGSYGGGIQLVEAGIDERVDAIVPGITWNSLNEAIYPTGDFKTSWSMILGLALLSIDAQVNSQIYPALLQGSIFGLLSESQQALLSSSGPTVLDDRITAPTLLIQGTVDGLFPLSQSVINSELISANDVPVNVLWYCGGHGLCLNPPNPDQPTLIVDSTLNWLDKYVMGNELVSTGPRFQWLDQNGDLLSSELLPSDPAFYGAPIVAHDGGGSLFLNPIIGGSGPQTKALDLGLEGLLLAPTLAAPATIAIDIAIPGPASTQEVVGAPELSFTYSGLGTSRHIYAQLVDDQTDLVLGNLVTPVPVDLDGGTHTVTIDLAQIAYTMEPGDSLTLQLVGSSSVYADYTQWGFIDVDEVEITLPTVAVEDADVHVAA